MKISKNIIIVIIFLLGIFSLTTHTGIKHKSYAILNDIMAKPQTPLHKSRTDEIFAQMNISPKMHRHLTAEERQKLALELSRLYARNMALIGKIEPLPHTPHLDPDVWAAQKIESWSALDAEPSPDEGIEEENEDQQRTDQILKEAHEEITELVKDNEGLEQSIMLGTNE